MHSKTTTNLGLPIFEPLNHPDFLTDWNEGMTKIDEFAGESKETISDLTNNLNVEKSSLEALTAQVDALQTKVDSISGGESPDITKLEAEIAEIKALVDSLDQWEGEAQADIASLKAKVSVLESYVSTLTDDYSSIEEKIDTIFEDDDIRDKRIVNLEQKVETLEAQEPVDTSELEGKVSTLEQKVEALETQEPVDTSELEGKVSTLEQKVEALEAQEPVDTSELEGKVSTLEQKVDALEAQEPVDTSELEERVSTLELSSESIASTANSALSKATAIEEQVEGIDSRVTALENSEGSAGEEYTHRRTLLKPSSSAPSAAFTAMTGDVLIEEIQENHILIYYRGSHPGSSSTATTYSISLPKGEQVYPTRPYNLLDIYWDKIVSALTDYPEDNPNLMAFPNFPIFTRDLILAFLPGNAAVLNNALIIPFGRLALPSSGAEITAGYRPIFEFYF